ncbi:MAG: SHOCT domain-containing protein [Acidimicrobiia bacterium]
MLITFWNVFWLLIWLWFLVVIFWIFIRIFIDIFRREDLSGWAKAGWVILIVLLPFLGALIYIIARPKMTEQDKREMEAYEQVQRRAAGYSSADEITKLKKLHSEGTLSDEEYEALKAQAM